jgi:hypothetical protein
VHAVVGGFTSGNTSFLVMNPDFHFDLAMDVIVCTAGAGRKNTNVLLVQKVLTDTSHVTSCIVMLKDVIKVRCFKKGRTIGSRISSLYFTAFNVP